MKIHPTSIISPDSNLADDVEVGPHAVIGDGVTLGPGCRVLANAILERDVTMGSGNTVGYGAVIGSPPQDFSYNESMHSEVRIGNDNTFREYVTIHRGAKEGSATVVGDNCYLMANAHLGHNVRLGNRIIVANACLLGGYADVDDGSVLGGGTVFHQNMRIGRLVMVRGGTRFGKDIPPYAMADQDNFLAGFNAIGMRRAGMSSGARLEIKRAYKLVFMSGLNISQGLEKAAEMSWGPETEVFFEFVRTSKRGMCRNRKFTDTNEREEG